MIPNIAATPSSPKTKKGIDAQMKAMQCSRREGGIATANGSRGLRGGYWRTASYGPERQRHREPLCGAGCAQKEKTALVADSAYKLTDLPLLMPTASKSSSGVASLLVMFIAVAPLHRRRQQMIIWPTTFLLLLLLSTCYCFM